jgi:ribulose-phosphate 3-epimerase
MADSSPLQLHLGVKADPIEYRFSYEWFFRLLAEEGIHHVQLGTFFEIYQLPDVFFEELRRKAEDFDIRIASIFTAHRELGGFFRTEPGFVEVARGNFERLIEVGALVGASSVGSNPGAVLRDQMGLKDQGIQTYLHHMKELMKFACDKGVAVLGIEPMSCLAEPPTLPDEMRNMAEELLAYHHDNPDSTSRVGYCLDVAHGYADRGANIVFDNLELLDAALPYTTELHLKNTDSLFNSTFGFSEVERAKGIVDVAAIRDHLLAHSHRLPVRELIGYLEIGGPKTGRDYTDFRLEEQLRASLHYLNETFLGSAHATLPSFAVRSGKDRPETDTVCLSPSMMCADLCNWEGDVRQLEALGVEYLHMDIMDAHFVPNMPLGLESLRHLRPKTALHFDVHLMVDNNDFFVREVAAIGARMISIHAESCTHLDRTINLIRDLGIEAGVALNPATPLSALEYVLDKLDFVLLMTVNPGYSGQRLVESTLDKIAQCRALLDNNGWRIPIEVDGNVSFEHIPGMVEAGADILVAGTSSLFHRGGSLRENFDRTNEAIGQGLAARRALR